MKYDSASTRLQQMFSGSRSRSSSSPLGCDTFVALPPAAPAGTTIFGKNSDRPCGEGQSVRRYPAADHDASSTQLQCTYISIPQVAHTHAVLLSQIDWMWGAEMGANEHGVVIGNEAVWTIVDDEPLDKPALLGMDLVRLGLERATTAQEAMGVMTNLLETYGQGGACAENDPSFTYHNSYLIADGQPSAIVLETAGRHWVAEHITAGTRNISNGLTIRADFNYHSDDLFRYAKKRGLWKEGQSLDWAASFSEGGLGDLKSPYSRQGRGCKLLQQPKGTTNDDGKKKPWMTPERMMEILRDHEGGLCMHGPGFETTASIVSEICCSIDNKTTPLARHWMTGQPLPCRSTFQLEPVVLREEKKESPAK